jgi:hypothetical protein
MAGGTVLAMASQLDKGTAFMRPDGAVVAVRMGPGVTAGQYFVLDPDNGGYYENDDAKVAEIESWKKLDTTPVPGADHTPDAPVAPPAPPAPAAVTA